MLFIIRFADILCVFFHQLSGDHDLMTAAQAFQAEIRTDTKDFPLAAATWMLLFQFYDITNFVLYHRFLLLPINCYLGVCETPKTA